MSEFKREDRYIVIKRSDMETLPSDTRRNFQGRCRSFYEQMLIAGAPARSFLVIESDWPEYEPAWQMIERRMTGQPEVTAAEELEAVLYWRKKHADGLKKRDALQQRLTAADERADTATSLIQRIVANFDTEIEYHEDVEPNDLEHDQVLTEMREFLAGSKPSTCTWSEGGLSWHTGCGKEWQFTDGGLPAENGMHFCHSCGKALVVESAEGCGKPCACPGCDSTRRANSPFCATHRSAKSRTRGQDPLTAEGLEWLMQNDGLQQ